MGASFAKKLSFSLVRVPHFYVQITDEDVKSLRDNRAGGDGSV